MYESIDVAPSTLEGQIIEPTPANGSTSRLNIPADLENPSLLNAPSNRPAASVAQWDSIQERNISVDNKIEEVRIDPPQPKQQTKPKKSSNRFSSIWSKMRGRKVSSPDSSATKKASFLSPISLSRKR